MKMDMSMDSQKTTVIIERQFDSNEVGTYTISENSSMQTIDEFVDSFIRPMLRVLGYSEQLINERLGEY